MRNQDKVLAEIYRETSRYIIEGGRKPRISGDKLQVEAIMSAAQASRLFYEALCDENSTLDAVITMMEAKKVAAENFKAVLGRDWRF
jgi:hypothetical protein